jgi:hypothetical protein
LGVCKIEIINVGFKMANKSFNEKLYDSEDMPKIIEITDLKFV